MMTRYEKPDILRVDNLNEGVIQRVEIRFAEANI